MSPPRVYCPLIVRPPVLSLVSSGRVDGADLDETAAQRRGGTRPALVEDHQRIAETEPGTDGPSGLSVAAVARRLGVAPGTLRTWDRRYGIGPSRHDSGRHRRYTPADVARLQRMRQLLLQGVSAADAARAAMMSPGGTFRGR
jgi:transposase-like protein